MKNTRRLVITVLALAALFLHSSQVGAETSVEIRLTLLPADSVNPAGPRWTPCNGLPSAPPRTGGAVYAVVTSVETGEREGKGSRFAPRAAYRPTVHFEEAGRLGGDGTSLSTTGATLRHDAVEGSLVVQTISGTNHTERSSGAEIPFHANSPISPEQPAKLVKPTIAGGEEVLVLPIKIPAQNGVVPHFRKVAVRLNVILPSVPPDELDASRIRYTFQSVPLEQSEPLPRATRVLKQPRIPGE